MIIPGVFYIFSKYSPSKAVLISFFGAVLFLPMEELQVPLILYNKMTAVGIGVLAAMFVHDGERVKEFPFRAADIPMVLWLSAGIFASVLNGLGLKDGIQEAFNTFMLWGVPYMAGRLYLSGYKEQLLMCRFFFMAALVYLPFVYFELVMSPQAHRIVYGYMQHDFSQVIRGNGYRPMVFMQHGIMLGTFMCMGTLVGIWCTFTKVFPAKIHNVPTWMLTVVLLISSIACKSSGAVGLMLLGTALLVTSSKLKTQLLVWVVILIPIAYISTRATGYWDGQNAVDLVAEKFSEDRSLSLKFRMDNENILIEKAMEKPIFGWGGWGRSRVYDPDTGEDISTTDGFWIITLGRWGFLGLFSVSMIVALPMILFLIRFHPRTWHYPRIAPAVVLALMPLLFLIDCTLNAMVNQMYILCAGSVMGMKSGDEYLVKSPTKATDGEEKDKKTASSGRGLQPDVVTRFHVTSGYSGPRFHTRPSPRTGDSELKK